MFCEAVAGSDGGSVPLYAKRGSVFPPCCVALKPFKMRVTRRSSVSLLSVNFAKHNDLCRVFFFLGVRFKDVGLRCVGSTTPGINNFISFGLTPSCLNLPNGDNITPS